ncbi:MAG: recombination protein RmuC [Alphaproteobacteria bacterium]|jgi:DNA recombination protein RmuC|nr:recombination protein RmuC [Alphaproteobacteria bacterium]
MIETLLIAMASLIAGAGLAAVGMSLLRTRISSSDPAEQRLAEIHKLQSETAGQVKAMGDMLTKAQTDLSERLGKSVDTAKEQTVANLTKLNERLAVIDNAQKNITDLASQVTSLQSVLGNKQQRGAFGQGRMEMIIQDALPKDCYKFQHTLPNKSRPDCCISMPDNRPLVIDAKFPLESVTAFREAKSDDERRQAAARLRQDVGKHVTDMAQKYLIPGETQDMALMFVPSESVYAELYDGFDDIVQKAYRAKIVIVSPSLLMLAIQVVQQIQKDARMREAADQIHTEVEHMMKDVRLLGERVRKLQTHFGQTTEDMKDILTSTGRIEKRGERIREVEFGGGENETDAVVIPAPMRKLEAGE